MSVSRDLSPTITGATPIEALPANAGHSTAEGQKRLMAEAMGLPADTYTRKAVNLDRRGDYGADPAGDGLHRMIPSGDLVTYDERCKRLSQASGEGE